MFELSDLYSKLDRILSQFAWRGINPPDLDFGTLFEELKEIAEDVSCGFKPYVTHEIITWINTKKSWNYNDRDFLIIFLADEGLVPESMSTPIIEKLESWIASPGLKSLPWGNSKKSYKGTLHRSK